jgi:putative transcriptional regulator
MSKLFKKLKGGFEEMIAHRKGKITLRSERIELPDPPQNYKAADIRQIREKGHYSQAVFAIILNVSVKTVQFWEAGERTPTHSALRLLEIVDKGIYRPKVYQKSTR